MTHLSMVWATALREHARRPLEGEKGPYLAVSGKSLSFLDALWGKQNAALPDIGAMIEAGKAVRFWADPHFGHDNIRHLASRREFRDVDEMDCFIWGNVERAVSQSNLVVCLGDLALKNPFGIQQKLKAAFGEKHLTVVGNHDAKGAKPGAWAASGAFAALAFSLPLELLRSWIAPDHGERAGTIDWNVLPQRVNFGCSHWPVPADRLPAASWVNLHGHIHNRQPGPLGINCSVEAIGYQPKTLRELLTPDIFENLVLRATNAMPKLAARKARLTGYLSPEERSLAAAATVPSGPDQERSLAEMATAVARDV